MANNNNPWLALKTYEERDSDKFKGREKDSENMLRMLQQNDCVVCYAASGDGKSSLINAGLCPLMRKDGLFPLKIIFTTAEFEGRNIPMLPDGQHVDFDKFILSKIEKGIDDYQEWFIKKSNISADYTISFQRERKYSDLNISQILWWKLRTETIQIPFGEYDYIPVLIFDQFEEIFSAAWKADFFKWLEILMKDLCPDNISNGFGGDVDDLPNRKLFKTIFSMRYEYVGELDYWCSQRTYIPQIMHSRYFLKPLSRTQAISVIQTQTDNDEISFKLKENADIIVDNIIASSSLDNKSDEVPAIVLSLVCYVLFDEWSENENYSLNSISLNEIIYNYYRDKLKEIGVLDNHRRVLEDVLISSQNTRLRIPVSDNRLQEIGISNYLNGESNIVSNHLVKKTNSNGEDYLEIIHDKLADAIYKKRSEERKSIHKSKVFDTKKRRGYLFVVLLFSLLLCGLTYWSISPSNNNGLYTGNVDDAEKELIVYDNNYFESDYSENWNSTSLVLKKDTYKCLHGLDCYNNVIYESYSRLYYAHNARELTFARKLRNQYDLHFGSNVKQVYLLYPENVASIRCENKHTRIYVPFKELDRCIESTVFDNVHVEEMGFFKTFTKKLLYEIRLDHLDFICKCGHYLPMWMAISVFLFFFIFYVIRRRDDYKNRFIFYLFSLFGGYLLYIIFIELAWKDVLDSKWVGAHTLFVTIIIGLFYLYVDRILLVKKNKFPSTPYCIIFNSTSGKQIAVTLKKALVDDGINANDIKLDLAVVRNDIFNSEIAMACVLSSKHCIGIFQEEDFTENDENQKYWAILNRSKLLHPIIIGIDNLDKINVPNSIGLLKKKRGGLLCFPSVFIENKEITQTDISIIVSALMRKFTPKRKGCMIIWLIVVILYFTLILLTQL